MVGALEVTAACLCSVSLARPTPTLGIHPIHPLLIARGNQAFAFRHSRSTVGCRDQQGDPQWPGLIASLEALITVEAIAPTSRRKLLDAMRIGTQFSGTRKCKPL